MQHVLKYSARKTESKAFAVAPSSEKLSYFLDVLAKSDY